MFASIIGIIELAELRRTYRYLGSCMAAEALLRFCGLSNNPVAWTVTKQTGTMPMRKWESTVRPSGYVLTGVDSADAPLQQRTHSIPYTMVYRKKQTGAEGHPIDPRR